MKLANDLGGCSGAAGAHTNNSFGMNAYVHTYYNETPTHRESEERGYGIRNVSSESDPRAHRRQCETYLQHQWNNHRFLVYLSSGFVMEMDSIETAHRFCLHLAIQRED